MSEYCNCCTSNIEWFEVHHFIDLEEIMDSDPKELASEIWESSKNELSKNASALNELIVLIEDIQYVYQPSTVRRVSIHEAGHAVMDYHYGDKIVFIEVGIETDRAGGVKSIGESEFGKKLKEETDSAKVHHLYMAEIKKYCHVMLAGVAAVHIYDGKRRIFPTLGAEVDIDNCKNFLKALLNYSFTDQDIYSQFFPETVEILEEKWKAVEALAQVLEEKWSDDGAVIEGEEAEQVIKKSIEIKI
jgi:hypothetical protein